MWWGGDCLGVSEWFNGFCNNIRISDKDVRNIQHRYKCITKRINVDYWNSDSETSHSLYVGSYGRGTDIYTSDIDIIVRLPYATYEKFDNYSRNGQSALLQEVKMVLQKTYSTSYLKGDGQVVGLNFKDGICFEIVPAFINKDDSYTYADTHNGGSWKATDPRKEIAAMNAMNRSTNKNLKRLCRMLRAWKEKWNVSMNGLLIDTLAYRFIEKWGNKEKSYLYYDHMTRDFFEYLSRFTNTSYCHAPGSNDLVYIKENYSRKASSCYHIAQEAISKETDYPSTAISKWREIYGSKFPT